jgi:hypothetical protein
VLPARGAELAAGAGTRSPNPLDDQYLGVKF